MQGDVDPVSAPARLSGGRRALVWGLIVVASLIAIGSILTSWVDRQMLDEQSWREASAELIEDPAVRSAVSVYLVDELYANVDVAAALDERLPADLKPLAGTLAGALRQPATDAVDRLLDSPRVQQLWIEASSLAQQKLVNVLEDETGQGITTGDGVVTLDLGQILTELGSSLGLSQSTLDRIPPDAGEITVLRSDELAGAQTAVKALRILSAALFVLVLGMYALAVFLARGVRRPTLRNVGWALVLVGLAALVARRVTGRYAVDALTSTTSHEAGERTWLIGSDILAQIGWAAIIYGAVVVVGAILAGPTARATAVRRRLAPVLNHQAGIVWAAVGFAYLLLVLWGPTHALRVLWGVVLLAALLALGVVALRRQTLREFPDGGVASVAGPLEARVGQTAPVVGTRGAGNGES
jgi:hypothetical protein